MKTVFKNVRLLDGVSNEPREKMNVVVGEERIERVTAGELKGFSGRVLDCRGQTLMPGLVDVHVHLSGSCGFDVLERLNDPTAEIALRAAGNARKTLLGGITMVRNAGEKAYCDVFLAHSIEQGENQGCRVISCGRGISITGGHGHPAIREISGSDDARQAVREHVKAGVDQIKIIASGGVLSKGTSPGSCQLTDEELAAVVDEARRLGRRTCAHAHGTEAISRCIEAGIDTIEHCSLPDEAALERMAAKGIYMVPTFAAGEVMKGIAGMPAEMKEKAAVMDERKKELFKLALACGVKIAMGTDAGSPFNYHGSNALELELLVRNGMDPMEALKAGTINGARVCRREELTGSIEEGKYADLLLVDGDPLADMAVLQDQKNLLLIMKAGRIVKYDSRDL